MNSIKLAIAATLLAISASSVQADTGSPSILSSVAANSVETLSNADASKTRGEYRVCAGPFFAKVCSISVSSRKLSNYNGWWSSRKYLFSFKKYGWWGKRYYVAR